MLKSGEDLVPVTAARGTLIRLKGSTIEMLIWFILHEQREFGKIDFVVLYSFTATQQIVSVEYLFKRPCMQSLQIFEFHCGENVEFVIWRNVT